MSAITRTDIFQQHFHPAHAQYFGVHVEDRVRSPNYRNAHNAQVLALERSKQIESRLNEKIALQLKFTLFFTPHLIHLKSFESTLPKMIFHENRSVKYPPLEYFVATYYMHAWMNTQRFILSSCHLFGTSPEYSLHLLQRWVTQPAIWNMYI